MVRRPSRGGVTFLQRTRGDHASFLARLRRTARAELYRRLNPDHQPTTWGFRLCNGGGQQQITVLLPNPHLDAHQNYENQPDWSRLYLWDRLRAKYLAQGVDPTDRTAAGFWHG